jgi:signal transduction histidine kinase
VDQHLVTAADLVAATEEARRSGTAKSDFIARMSHELRAPLNAIIGYSEILLENAENDDDKATIADVDRIRSAGRQLLKLVNRILDLSRAEAGRMEVVKEWVDCGGLVDAVVRDAGPLANKNGNSVSVVRQGGLGLIRTDSPKLKQVLANILENAFQYTRNGVVTVSARRIPNEGGDRITLSVADSGPGIERERLPYLLNSFETLDDDDHRSASGAGLGLALSKKLCDLIGAKLSVESEVGRGSVFTVELRTADAPSDLATGKGDLDALQEAAIEGLKAVAEGARAVKTTSQGHMPYAKVAAG